MAAQTVAEAALAEYRGYLEHSRKYDYSDQTKRMFEKRQRHIAKLELLVRLLEAEVAAEQVRAGER